MLTGMWPRVILLAFLAGLLPALFAAKPAVAASVPAGFEDRLVTSADQPTALEFTPDGRMLVTDKAGILRVYKDGGLLATPALDISRRVCGNGERGMLGVAADPDFAANHHVYLYYTAKVGATCEESGDDVNRVSRFTMNGDTLEKASEKRLIDNIPSPRGNHNAGDLHFGKDGYLYVSVGDGGCNYTDPTRCQYENDASRDRHILLGKILRITADGDIPSTNPYQGTDSARCNVTGRTKPGKSCRETFAWGLRNPFRMAFDPDAAGTSFRINEVGGHLWEEIDTGEKGADYGWNCREGRHVASTSGKCDPTPPGMVDPIHEYSHDTGCSSVTGGAFVPDGAWPAGYDDSYLFGDYVCGKIFELTPDGGGGFGSSEFVTGLGQGGPIAMAFGPYRGGKALYYTTFAGGGEVRRIAYGADYPTASIRPSQAHGPEKTITFDGSASKDHPQDGPLTYVWDFGDGSTQTTAGAENTASHTYAASGKYTVKLTVRDDQGLEDTADVTVWPGDTPPEPEILSPTRGTHFAVGQRITLRGTATDAQDDAAPDLKWEVRRHHNGDHTHPYSSGTGTDPGSFAAPPPEDLLSTDPTGNYLEVRLTATDSQGLSKTVTRKLRPETVGVKFATRPTDFLLAANGVSFRAPETFVSWQGYEINVYAPRQRHGDESWVFRSWSDGGDAGHTVTTPADPVRYGAVFGPRR